MTQLHSIIRFHRFRTRNFYRLVAPGSHSIGPTDFPAFRRSHSRQIHQHSDSEELPPKSWHWQPFSVEVTLPIFVRTQLRCKALYRKVRAIGCVVVRLSKSLSLTLSLQWILVCLCFTPSGTHTIALQDGANLIDRLALIALFEPTCQHCDASFENAYRRETSKSTPNHHFSLNHHTPRTHNHYCFYLVHNCTVNFPIFSSFSTKKVFSCPGVDTDRRFLKMILRQRHVADTSSDSSSFSLL